MIAQRKRNRWRDRDVLVKFVMCRARARVSCAPLRTQHFDGLSVRDEFF